MIITYRRSFLEASQDQNSKIRLGYLKLGEDLGLDLESESTSVLLKDTSPTIGTYPISVISGTDGDLQFSMTPGVQDASVSIYKNLFILYDNIMSGEQDIAFILTLEEDESLVGTLNIFDIHGFSPKCHIEYTRTSDINTLERSGQGRFVSYWKNTSLPAYLTKRSWESAETLMAETDNLRHLDTVFIDEYGFKTY